MHRQTFYQTAIRGLDAELELYELLDLDAEGIDDDSVKTGELCSELTDKP